MTGSRVGLNTAVGDFKDAAGSPSPGSRGRLP